MGNVKYVLKCPPFNGFLRKNYCVHLDSLVCLTWFFGACCRFFRRGDGDLVPETVSVDAMLQALLGQGSLLPLVSSSAGTSVCCCISGLSVFLLSRLSSFLLYGARNYCSFFLCQNQVFFCPPQAFQRETATPSIGLKDLNLSNRTDLKHTSITLS